MFFADLPPIPAVILAAGDSTRLGQPKQLLRLNNSAETLIERTTRLAKEAGAAPIFVVLGAYSEEIQNAGNLLNSVILVNAEWPEGMASSLRLGIASCLNHSPMISGALLMVCDQPALSVEHLRKLLTAHQTEPEIIVASRYAGRAGVPAVLPRTMFSALLTLTGDQGARAIFGQAESYIHEIDFPGGEWDIDTAEDLDRMNY